MSTLQEGLRRAAFYLREHCHGCTAENCANERHAAMLEAHAESLKPAGWFHELLDYEGKPNGVLLGVRGTESEHIVRQAHIEGETDAHVFPLYALDTDTSKEVSRG